MNYGPVILKSNIWIFGIPFPRIQQLFYWTLPCSKYRTSPYIVFQSIPPLHYITPYHKYRQEKNALE